MYVLIFVTMMMMLLSILTYARLDSYRSLSGLQVQFKRYMEVSERDYMNREANRRYDMTVANKSSGTSSAASGQASPAPASEAREKKSEEGETARSPQKDLTETKPPQSKPEPASTKGKSSPRLSFYFLADVKGRESNPAAYTQTYRWAKNLMVILYGHERFFKQMMQERPTFLDDLLSSLPGAAEDFKKQEAPTKGKIPIQASDLANFNLGGGLEPLFYLMLKGCPALPLPDRDYGLGQQGESLSEDEGVPDNEIDEAEEAKEPVLSGSYNSLLNYITMKNSKVRVYLASRDVLLAIYGNQEIVESIIQTRYALYRSYKKGANKSDLTNQFKSLFQNRVPEGDDSLLDFEVTGTDPSKYTEAKTL